MGAVDQQGRFVAIDWPGEWTARVLPGLPDPARCALFGFVSLGDRGVRLRCLAIVSAHFGWGRGPVFPDV
jgi:hypothetical protein